ncbi:unnamed protein product [Fusarium equiseti]|uniref:Heterokaryon incompatibility domain-containing protein n=1 Tax=Fusarium equiseti TaxID=61235 RepID=A0A8J2JDR5_FUSEQ|nr:unnamed protein product [Fusarium equiseti]
MEHLIFKRTRIPDPEHPGKTIPWADAEEPIGFVEPMTLWLGFDHDSVPFGDFETYPERSGYNTKHLWNGYLGRCHESFETLQDIEKGRRVAAFLQSWLSLGLVESVRSRKINTQYLTRQHTDGQTYINTRNLTFGLYLKVLVIQGSELDSALRKGQSISNTIEVINRWITRFTHWSHPRFRQALDRAFPGFMDLIDDFTPSVVRLGEAVDYTRAYALSNRHGTIVATWDLPINPHDARSNKLKSLGWCPFQIQFAERTLNNSTLDWMCAVNFSQKEAGHEACTKKACARSDIDNKTYKQSHCCEHARCNKVKLDLDEIREIIDQGGYPVLSMEIEEGNVKFATKACSSAKPINYIALSHVWADGIGGEAEYGLNRCQVERVHKLCRSYNPNGNGWFWLDSLCIPSKNVGEETYMKSLVSIRDVYINATTVLVLDKRIGDCYQSAPEEILFANIYMSAWMQRMWAYEEAVLAKRLVFVLKDGFYTHERRHATMGNTVRIVWENLAVHLDRLRLQHRLTIGHIYQGFRFRLTNVPGEEFLSVSGMLNLDTSSLVNFKGEERVKRFWLLLGDVPDNLPLSTAPKLTDVGFRWAPKTMMCPSRSKINTDPRGPTSRCTPDGLVGRYLTIELDKTLSGSADTPGCLFHVWMDDQPKNEDIQHPWQEAALLRIHGPWPEVPATHEFDMLYLTIDDGERLSQGEWIPGAAALQTSNVSSDSSSSRCIRHVTRVLIEKLRVGEMTHRNATIMYRGADDLALDAQGISRVEEVCIV